LRICVYDNLANNAYNIAKGLRRMGFGAEVGLDPDDVFPMSQPLWEDVDFEMPIGQFSGKSLDYWIALEKEKGYQRPDFVKYIGRPTWSVGRQMSTNLSAAISHPAQTLRSMRRSGGSMLESLYTLTQMEKVTSLKEYDYVIAFGLGPSLAYLAGVPYSSIPYGGDLVFVPKFLDDRKWTMRARARLQRSAYQNSDNIFLYNDPTLPEILRSLGITSWQNFSLPIDHEKYRPLPNQRLDDLLDPKVAERARNKIVMLMPSRVDFAVKGSDKALRAFARLAKARKDVFLIMMGWGVDLEKAKDMASELGIVENVHFHPHAASKPRLIRLINAVDIVLDQFGPTGAYGTTTIETLSCGKPLLINIDWQKMKSFFETRPPVMDAGTEDEILASMTALCNSEKRESVGRSEREWVVSNHSAEKSLSKIVESLKR